MNVIWKDFAVKSRRTFILNFKKRLIIVPVDTPVERLIISSVKNV